MHVDGLQIATSFDNCLNDVFSYLLHCGMVHYAISSFETAEIGSYFTPCSMHGQP